MLGKRKFCHGAHLTPVSYSTMETKRKPNLTTDEVNQVIADLIDKSSIVNGERRLAPGAVTDSAIKFKISRNQVYKLWRSAMKKRKDTGTYYLSPRKKGKVGRPTFYDREWAESAVEQIDPKARTCFRDLSEALGVSTTTAWKMARVDNILQPHSAAVKPILTEEHKLFRLMYAANRIIQRNNDYVYRPCYNEIHVDEKWFDIQPCTQRLYLTNKEIEENKIKAKAQHKSHITKVMFLTAVARPRFNNNGECTFDGKIGMWPFVEKLPAKRNSKNRPKGTLETKNVSVTKDRYREYLINKVLPAIYARFPCDRVGRGEKQPVLIQQDNPYSHIKKDDPEWVEACAQHRHFAVQLIEQPANSPDTNVLDLGLFRALQSQAWKLKRGKTIDNLIENVQKTWDAYDASSLNRIWLTHQSILDEILLNDGGNDYDIPHINKGGLERMGQLPESILVSDRALELARRVRDI